MYRLIAALGIAILTASCSSGPSGPSTAAYTMKAPEPECLQATPGNSLDGFRCTGDYTGDGSSRNGGRN